LIVRHEQTDFEEPSALVAEAVDALTSGELSLLVLSGDFVGATALTETGFERPYVFAQGA
jgi:hypothetical protein